MPTCAKCSKKTFDGTRWNSTIIRKEFNGKYLCSFCHQETETKLAEYNRISVVQKQEQEVINQKAILNQEIEATKDKLKTLESIKANDDLKGYSEVQAKQKHIAAGSGNVYGILSIVFAVISFVILGILFSAAAIACGVIAYRHNDRKGVIGIVIGAMAFLLSLMVLLG